MRSKPPARSRLTQTDSVIVLLFPFDVVYTRKLFLYTGPNSFSMTADFCPGLSFHIDMGNTSEMGRVVIFDSWEIPNIRSGNSVLPLEN